MHPGCCNFPTVACIGLLLLLLLLLLLRLLRCAEHKPLLHLCMGGSGALRTHNQCFDSRCGLSMWSVQGATAHLGIWLDATDC